MVTDKARTIAASTHRLSFVDELLYFFNVELFCFILLKLLLTFVKEQLSKANLLAGISLERNTNLRTRAKEKNFQHQHFMNIDFNSRF